MERRLNPPPTCRRLSPTFRLTQETGPIMALPGRGLVANGLRPGRVASPVLLQPLQVLGWYLGPLLHNPTPHVCCGLLLPLLQRWGALGNKEGGGWRRVGGGGQRQKAEVRCRRDSSSPDPQSSPSKQSGWRAGLLRKFHRKEYWVPVWRRLCK